MKSLILFLTLNPLQLQGDTPILSSSHLAITICVCSRVCHCVTQFGNTSASVSLSPGTTKGVFPPDFSVFFLHFPLFSLIFIFPLPSKKKKILVMRR